MQVNNPSAADSEKSTTPFLSREFIKISLFAFFYSVLASITTQLILRNIYMFLAFDEHFFKIFKQLSTANMHTPVLLITLISYIFAWVFFAIRKRESIRAKIFSIAIIILSLPLTLTISLYFTKVNDILFSDVVRSLIPLLESGVL